MAKKKKDPAPEEPKTEETAPEAPEAPEVAEAPAPAAPEEPKEEEFVSPEATTDVLIPDLNPQEPEGPDPVVNDLLSRVDAVSRDKMGNLFLNGWSPKQIFASVKKEGLDVQSIEEVEIILVAKGFSKQSIKKQKDRNYK